MQLGKLTAIASAFVFSPLAFAFVVANLAGEPDAAAPSPPPAAQAIASSVQKTAILSRFPSP